MSATPPTDRPLTADEWIGWHGGENPVPGQIVKWQTRNEPNRDDCETAVPSEALDWSHPPRQAGNPPVIAYRIARPGTSAASEGEGVSAWPEEMTPEMEQVWRSAFIGQGHLRRNQPGRVKHPESCERAAYRALRKFVAKAALASPPVSERERELEGALRLAATAIGCLTFDDEVRSIIGNTNFEILKANAAVIRRLTAQPQEPV